MADLESLRMERDPSDVQTPGRSNTSLATDDGAKLQHNIDGDEPAAAGLPQEVSEKQSRSSQSDEEQYVPDPSTPKKASRVGRKNRIFPPRQADPFYSRGGDPALDYEKKYPADDIGLEMGSSARVWRVYMDEAGMFDAEMVQKFMDTVDLLLVFAGLFSAVVTTFVVQSSQSLQPDYALITTSLMTEMVLLQRAMAQGIPETAVNISKSALDVSSVTSERMDTWINGLWFTSLSFALSVALFAILVKQWLHSYISAYTGTPRDRAVARQIRYDNLGRWGVPIVIGFLPVLLHIALLLFFIGLVLFIHQLQIVLIYAILPFAGVGYATYFVSVALPIFFRDCPYQTPVSTYSRDLIAYCRSFYARHIRNSSESSEGSPSTEGLHDLLTDAMVWLNKYGSNPTCRTIVTKALAASVDFIVNPSHSSDHRQRLHDDGFAAAASALARIPKDEWSEAGTFPVSEELNLRVVLLHGYVPDPSQPWSLSYLKPIIGYHGQVEPVILAQWSILHFGELTKYMSYWEDKYAVSDLCHDLDHIILGEDTLPPLLWMRILSSLHTLVSSQRAHPTVRGLQDTLLQLLVLGCRKPPPMTAAFDWYDTGTLSFAEMCSSNQSFNDQLLRAIYSGLSDGREHRSDALDPMLVTLECIGLWAKNIGEEGQVHESDFLPMMVDFLLVDIIDEVQYTLWENYAPHIWETMNHLLKDPMHPGHTGRAYIQFMRRSLNEGFPKNVNMSTEIEYILEVIQTLFSPNKPEARKPPGNEGNHFPERYICRRINSWLVDPLQVGNWFGLLRQIIDRVGFNFAVPVLESPGLFILLSPAARRAGSGGTKPGVIILTLLAQSYIARRLTAHPETLDAMGSQDNLIWLLTAAIFIDTHRRRHVNTVQDVLAGLHAAVPSSNPSWRTAIIAAIGAMNKRAESEEASVWVHLPSRYSILRKFAAEKLGINFDSSEDFAPRGFTVPDDLETEPADVPANVLQVETENQPDPDIDAGRQENSNVPTAGRVGSFLRKVRNATKFVRSSQSRVEEQHAEIQAGDEAV